MKPGKYHLNILILILGSVATGKAQVSYTATPVNTPSDLFNSTLSWISDDGTTGFGAGIQSTTYQTVCFTYQNGVSTEIPTPGFSCGTAAADVGHYVMSLAPVPNNAITQTRLASYSNGQFNILTPPLGVTFPGYPSGMGVNKAGQMVGTFYCQNAAKTQISACGYSIASDGTFTPLSNLGAAFGAGAINESGEIAGWVGTQSTAVVSPWDAVVWSPTDQRTDLSSLSTLQQLGYPIAINSKGQVLGANGGTNFFYDGAGNITPVQVPGATSVTPAALNDSGEVVGYYTAQEAGIPHAFHWVNGQAVDLNTVVTNLPSYLFLIYAEYINNSGQILVTAAYTSQPVGVEANGTTGTQFLLTPVVSSSATPAPPAIAAVVNGASFASGTSDSTWITIQGTNLSTTTRPWAGSDFAGNALPTSLDGVSVTVNGLRAYPSYISPTQLNVLTPDTGAAGAVEVQVINGQGTSKIFTVNQSNPMPGFFVTALKYVTATHADGAMVGASGLISGVTTTPAVPGETISLYGTGFGAAVGSPAVGTVLSAPAELANQVTVTIGGQPATVTYAGLTSNGLDQVNVTIPDSLPGGDALVVAKVSGVPTQADLYVTVQK